MFRFFKQADSSKLSKRKMMEKIEPLCVILRITAALCTMIIVAITL
jgi:hypothetical protein